MADRHTEDKSPKEECRVKTFYTNLTSEVDTHFARALSMTAIQAQSPAHSKSKSPSPITCTSPGIESMHHGHTDSYELTAGCMIMLHEVLARMFCIHVHVVRML